ncbi:hypothetical protein P8452_36304 [Trifolium repens]|nr:hypothetical protein P8452_36304 [Trifolium repens]
MGVIKSAIGDAILTSIFVFFISTLRLLSTKTSLFLNLEPVSLPGLFITTILNTIIILTISLIGRILGGASFNPSSTISFYTLGLRPNSSLLSLAITFPAQAIGAAFGIKTILQVMPNEYKHMMKGPSLKVDLHTGAIVEGPSMNPANAFGWAYMNNKHNTWEQFYVFWICPLIGASSAALVYRFVFMSPIKEKKA